MACLLLIVLSPSSRSALTGQHTLQSQSHLRHACCQACVFLVASFCLVGHFAFTLIFSLLLQPPSSPATPEPSAGLPSPSSLAQEIRVLSAKLAAAQSLETKLREDLVQSEEHHLQAQQRAEAAHNSSMQVRGWQ